jgi:hypothetical protein
VELGRTRKKRKEDRAGLEERREEIERGSLRGFLGL